MQVASTIRVVAAGVALSLGFGIALAQSGSVHVPVQSLKWFDTGIGPMKAAMAYGDMGKGPYGAVLKMPKGFVSPVHLHSHDYRAVVVSGTVVNSEVGKPDIRMEPGSYWFQVGNVQHVTKCVSADGCMVFLTQTEKFDFVPSEAAGMKK
jgi:quercetin dioxygenase-like cupin family protein